MTTQLNLFDRPTEQQHPFQRAAMPGRPAPHSGGETSSAAAGEMKSQAGRLRQAVLAFVIGRGVDGATDQEIGAALGLDSNTARPRRWELAEAGLIVDSGIRRRTSSGRKAVVWVAPEHLQQERF